MPRHIEQPAPRHSAPASLKTTSSPSSSACSRTRTDPGTTSRRVSLSTWRPLMISAASAQVLDPAVGARADEDGVDLDVAHRCAGLERHVLQRLLGRDLVLGVLELVRARDRAAERHPLAGVGAPGDERRHPGGVEDDLGVVLGVVVGDEGLPVADRGVPLGALRRLGTSLDVVEGLLVGRDQPRLGTPLDAHVADRHPALHRELLDGRAAVLDDVALAAAGAGVGDQREHQVLGGDTRRAGCR